MPQGLFHEVQRDIGRLFSISIAVVSAPVICSLGLLRWPDSARTKTMELSRHLTRLKARSLGS